ncbi:MAG: protein kinase, partial [Myxococcales bacterium]|nr:protein kinase [Myxococcales bacterium]
AVKLIDFGVAGALSGVHQSIDRSRRVGRPSYMAPEVLVGQPITASIDQYALGVTLYELLVGERPHGAGEDAVEATLSGRHRPLLAARPDLPPPFALAVERAMSVHVAERFRDCGALARALLAAIPGTLDPRLALADLVYGAASDVLPHEIEAVARLSRAATELFAAREQP